MAFTPRLTAAGIRSSAYWYSRGNIYYATGYGMPNCTCYAYGRAGEIMNGFVNLPMGNGGQWWDRVDSSFLKGQTPALGAVICFHSPSGAHAGHVAVVEVINADGSIITSNSAWRGTYFWTETLYPSHGYLAPWAVRRGYVVQGFIYLTDDPPEPQPTPAGERRKMPFIYYLKKFN